MAAVPHPNEKDMAALYTSIKMNGLIEPILVTKKMEVIDGRCRLYACLRLKMPVRHKVFEGTDDEAIKTTVALNLHRRHLTVKQKAILGDRIATYKAGGDRKSNRRATVTTIKDAAKQVGVSPSSIERSRKVRTKATPAKAR